MKRIVLASRNPVKARAALGAFERVFPRDTFTLDGVSVPSGVSDQPRSEAETLRGAKNRAEGARRSRPEADFWVGIEGGIVEEDGIVVEDGVDKDGDEKPMTAFAWMVVLSGELEGRSRSASFALPRPVARLVRQGKELGEADDIVFGRSRSKTEEGAVGLLTDRLIDRAALYEHAMILALIPFRHPHWY